LGRGREGERGREREKKITARMERKGKGKEVKERGGSRGGKGNGTKGRGERRKGKGGILCSCDFFL